MNYNRNTVCQSLVEEFNKRYGYRPAFVSISPGRVNLIGEHIDHQGYSVLPVAINQTVQVAIGLNKGGKKNSPDSHAFMTCSHADSKTFATITFECLKDLQIGNIPSWVDFIVASFFGILEYQVDPRAVGQREGRFAPLNSSLLEAAESFVPHCGIQLLIDGNVPIVWYIQPTH